MFFQNHLIELLPDICQRELLALCKKVPFTQFEVLWNKDEITSYVYFPAQGLISLLAAKERGGEFEVALIGNEGMLGAEAALGVVGSSLRAVAQTDGWAWRLETTLLQKELMNCMPLKSILDRYVAVRMTQLTTALTCLHCHEVVHRLARSLLMHQDRLCMDRLNLTQDHLSTLLGVRRVSITHAAGELQRRKLIEYQRGSLLILNRLKLEAAACSCYRIDLSTYFKLMH